MWSTDREVAAGDVVIIWQTRDIIQPLLITPGKDLNSRFGHYRHADLIGVPYGSKVGSSNGKGFIHVLRPTPELWTMALPHRTQILYLADIAFITSWLNIRRGSRVIEAGTGSGSFSHSVVRTIGSAGHLWSYEFHEVRAEKAREEFNRHGMADIVTLTHRNVCKDGFTVTDTVDSVFLDLPAPWDAVEHAKKALRKDCTTRICCFSPCMEQVLRTVTALNDAGFTDITMYETLLKPHDVHQIPVPISLSDIVDKLKKSEFKREEKRLRQIANSSKRKRDSSVDKDDGSKKAKTDDDTSNTAEIGPAAVPVTIQSITETTPVPSQPAKVNLSKPMQEVRGHTSYLTFARLLPISFSPQMPDLDENMVKSDTASSS
ncbi:tRNA methyltransferase complex subunit Cpd1 [Hygrophoropsis aurantiaca]|uniref:tRNA methyltransferase complex subunit Cpd1 n=1 Tax=Hygrophoropsis aurantiaca TaxID=72124 RepID=A0ACB8A7K8_9AGAM|nr:tRNA methyltransferase complex subunit Cpd1 [Hygrophoropsis aurantiaca]